MQPQSKIPDNIDILNGNVTFRKTIPNVDADVLRWADHIYAFLLCLIL